MNSRSGRYIITSEFISGLNKLYILISGKKGYWFFILLRIYGSLTGPGETLVIRKTKKLGFPGELKHWIARKFFAL
jgi:hypothetical protein